MKINKNPFKFGDKSMSNQWPKKCFKKHAQNYGIMDPKRGQNPLNIQKKQCENTSRKMMQK